jgi:hypothetical protein
MLEDDHEIRLCSGEETESTNILFKEPNRETRIRGKPQPPDLFLVVLAHRIDHVNKLTSHVLKKAIDRTVYEGCQN